jgi:hypothetical protein
MIPCVQTAQRHVSRKKISATINMALSQSITINGKTYKPTIFAIQAQASFAKSLIFVAEARVAVRADNYIWATIASYYSLFHLAISLMFMCPQLIEPTVLTRLGQKAR